MKSKGTVPMAVLSQQLQEAIDGRRVRAGVFTTFTFDPGFFELHILPTLFDQSFSQVDKVRRIQLEDALRSVDRLAVYYDRGALSQDGKPAQLDYRRIDVRRSTGCFHPKAILLLVDEEVEEKEDTETEEQETTPYQSLIVAIASANLTRAGWWENIECGHIEEIADRDVDPARCSFRPDLLALIRRLRDSAAPDEDHGALDLIRDFLRTRTERSRVPYASSRGRYHTRLFCGQGRKSLSAWLGELRLDRHDWNLEVISPYFDGANARTLIELLETVQPRETRVYLPKDVDGAARVTRKCYESVDEYAHWSRLPGDIAERGRGANAELLVPRTVHAKVYRLWNRKERRELLAVGSVNLTAPAHGHSGMGNLEAAFLVDVSESGYPRRWWLTPLETDAERFTDQQPEEEDGLETVPINISLRYDWGAGSFAYRLEGAGSEGFLVCETGGPRLFEVERPKTDEWIDCGEDAAGKARAALNSSSFLLVRHARGSWRVLVREENMAHRPSLLMELTPEEILEYWSLLSPEQRAAFIGDHAGLGETLEGLNLTNRNALASRNTLFDRFAGIFHAFGCLRRHVESAIAEGREAEAETRLLGAKYDSLPVLLEKTLSTDTVDPIVRYVTFLCARQVKNTIFKEHRPFLSARKKRAIRLETLIAKLPDLRAEVPLTGEDREGFLEWYEDIFLKEL